jgi:hypothetical protein
MHADALSNLHDGSLTGLASREKTLVLTCSSVGGKPLQVAVSGVRDMFATNVRMTNIILEAMVLMSIRDVPRGLLEGLAQSGDPQVVEPYVVRAEAAEVGTSTKYFVLQSSYGCDLVVVFLGDISLREECWSP